MLDAGDHKMVEAYELQWWTGRKPRNINTFEVLKASSLEKCLIHYCSQKIYHCFGRCWCQCQSPIIPDNDANASHIPIRPSSGPSFSHIPIASSSGIQTISRVPVGPSCLSCIKYCQLLTDVLQDINKFQSYASTMSTTSENLLNIGIHRASTFNMLHEAAILKETTGTSSLKGKLAEQISLVMKNASLELNQLKELPVLLYKWTWGEALMKDKVIKLCWVGTKPGCVQHSGYNISLKGSQLGNIPKMQVGQSN